jgi:GTP-binding protein
MDRSQDGEERPVRLIDTAGMRKKALVVEKLERMSVADARRAIDFAEVVVLLLDATRGLEHQDLKIASMVLEEGRALMIAINKWDVAEDASGLFNGIKAALDDGLAQVRGLPLMSVSARTGKGLDQMLSAAFELRAAWSKRVPTAGLNRWFDDALAANPPPAPVASGSSCAISPRPRPARPASCCSVRAWMICRCRISVI